MSAEEKQSLVATAFDAKVAHLLALRMRERIEARRLEREARHVR